MQPRTKHAATVLAGLDESASLLGMDGHQADGYRSSYDAQYKMVQVGLTLHMCPASVCVCGLVPMIKVHVCVCVCVTHEYV